MIRRTRPLQWVGLGGICLFLAVAFSPLSNAVFRWSAAVSDIQPADAIVVLGAAMDSDGTLSYESLVRTVRGVALYRTGRAPIWRAHSAFPSAPSERRPRPSRRERRPCGSAAYYTRKTSAAFCW